jgi:hypothetical protein
LLPVIGNPPVDCTAQPLPPSVGPPLLVPELLPDPPLLVPEPLPELPELLPELPPLEPPELLLPELFPLLAPLLLPLELPEPELLPMPFELLSPEHDQMVAPNIALSPPNAKTLFVSMFVFSRASRATPTRADIRRRKSRPNEGPALPVRTCHGQEDIGTDLSKLEWRKTSRASAVVRVHRNKRALPAARAASGRFGTAASYDVPVGVPFAATPASRGRTGPRACANPPASVARAPRNRQSNRNTARNGGVVRRCEGFLTVGAIRWSRPIVRTRRRNNVRNSRTGRR